MTQQELIDLEKQIKTIQDSDGLFMIKTYYLNEGHYQCVINGRRFDFNDRGAMLTWLSAFLLKASVTK